MADAKAGPDSINLDYRITTLLLALASREDLLKELNDGQNLDDKDKNKWPRLQKIGFPMDMLKSSMYLFTAKDSGTALAQTQKVMQTLVAINDYCPIDCPSDASLATLTTTAANMSSPLGLPGK
jgi:hypothetical protein